METSATVVDTRVTVRPVQTRRDLKRFIDLPYRFYRDNLTWAPPLRRDVAHTLNPKKNPFYEHGRIQPFLAQDEAGRVVGRIAAVVNGMHLKKYDDGNGFFGFFECQEDYATAEALFEAACDWLREQGLTGVRGPASPSLNDTSGLLVGGFDREPSLMMPYNPPYHETFLLRYGFTRAMTMWAYYVHKKYLKTDKLRRGVEIVYHRNPGLKLRTFNLKRFDEDAQIILDLYNDAWSGNWGHVPLTEAEFRRMAAELKKIVDPEMVFILEKDDEPVAFSITLPNLNRALTHIRDGRLLPVGLPKLLTYAKCGAIYDLRMLLMGVRKAYHGRAFDSIMVLATIENGWVRGYQGCEMSWVLDSNQVLKNAITAVGGVIDKEYALFEKSF